MEEADAMAASCTPQPNMSKVVEHDRIAPWMLNAVNVGCAHINRQVMGFAG